MTSPQLTVLRDIVESVNADDMRLLLDVVSKKTNALDGVDSGAVAVALHEILVAAVHARIKADQAMAVLSAREREVMRLLAEGHSNAYIAAILGCTERTVRAHMESMNRKTGTSNRTALLSMLSGAVLAFPPI